MAESDRVFDELKRRPGVRYAALTPNMRGFERALAGGADEVAIFAAASNTFSQRNINCTIDESLERFGEVAQAARREGVPVRGYVSCVVGCPYEGEVTVERIVEIADQLLQAQPVELALADTVGVAVPPQVREVVGPVRTIAGATPLRCHLHNTRNTGLANAMAAIEEGVATLDASIAGIGGCPFAPNATGNIPTDDLLYMLERSGITTGVSLPDIVRTTEWLTAQLGRELPALVPKAGIFPDNLRAAS